MFLPVQCDVAIVGAGFAGLCVAMKLREAGVRDIVILDRGDEVGGTWRDNTYPGAGSDVQAHLYSYSFEPKADWRDHLPGWREIRQYILDVVARRGIRPMLRFGREITRARFDPGAARWVVDASSGERWSARHLVLAQGPLQVPQRPTLHGIERFRGPAFHSARRDHRLDLTGLRVASIGTGASAVQYAPRIAPQVERLYVFQRTPSWVIPRDDGHYSESARRRFARWPWLQRVHRAAQYWENELRLPALQRPALGALPKALSLRMMREQVRDPALVAALTPEIGFGCKRLLISNEWYPMFNRANVELVTAGIREVRESSIVTDDGVERPVDCIVYGTGFVTDPREALRGMEVAGLDGRRLADVWRDGPASYYGVHVSGFPNLHRILGANTGLGHNSVLFMAEAQAHYIVRCLRALDRRAADWLDVRADAQEAFNARVQRALRGTAWTSGCSSWYQQSDGRNFLIWPWASWRYWLWSRRVDLARYRFGHAGVARSEVRHALARGAAAPSPG